MSRTAPFPTNGYTPTRVRSPAPMTSTNGAGASESVRPLQISRPSRPSSPGSQSNAGSSRGGPARPNRSDLRSRQPSEYSTSDVGTSRNSDYTQERPDGTTRRQPDSRGGRTANGASAGRTRERADTTDSQLSPAETNAASSALSAFKSAGMRKRTLDSYDPEYEREKEQIQKEQRETQRKIKEKVPGRRRVRPGDIDAVLDEINDEWAFVKEENFNPVDLALRLLDDTSGKNIESFRRTKNMLSKSLKSSVDTHYQAFAQSLPQHSTLFNHMAASQAQVKEARAALLDAKEGLGNKRADLVQIWSRGQTIEEMIRILDQIENLKTIADLLETLVSEKRFLQASVLLVQSLKLANKPDMQDIGAVSELRTYLQTQESLLREILVEELHNHLYVKSFWCESRWMAYSPGQQAMPRVSFEDTDATPDILMQPESTRRPRLSRFLDTLAVRNNDSPYEINDTTNLRNSAALKASINGSGEYTTGSQKEGSSPEADSFAYVEMLLESLAVLGRLGNALDITAQRVPSEIYALTDSTLEDVAERAEFAKRSSILGAGDERLDGVVSLLSSMASATTHLSVETLVVASNRGKDGFLPASALRSVALESSSKQIDHEILRDLFWTLYSKLYAVVQSLRVISEVATRIGSRRDFKDASGAKPGSLFPLAEIWMPVNAEIRTLLNDYITNTEQGAVVGINPIASINEVLREGKLIRDKAQHAFRFADTDLKISNKSLRVYEDELNKILRDTVPGLVQTNADSAVQQTLSALGTDERMIGAIQHHTLLVKPDAFHVSVLFQPTLAFLQRIADVLPSGMESARTSTAVLDEFVLKIYLPQLEDKVSTLFMQAVSNPEAFQLDPSSLRLSAQPLNKVSMQLMGLINSLCVMLRSSPFHKENYARLILGVIIQFYQSCFDRFQKLTTVKTQRKAMPTPVVAATWAQHGELAPVLLELLSTVGVASMKAPKLCMQETKVETALTNQTPIQKEQLLPTKDMTELSLLQHSVAWFTTELIALKLESNEPATPATPSITEPLSAITPFTPSLPQVLPLSPDDELKLPLSKESALRFQALLKTYELLAELILFTLRVDVRCRAIYYLNLVVKEGNYVPERAFEDPDSVILDLNNDLNDCDEAISLALPPRERSYVFEGLPQLGETLLISGAHHIPVANELGIRKMIRNIATLQQGLRMLSRTENDDSVQLAQAKAYYSLFFIPPADMIAEIRRKPVFSFDDYNSMLNLKCGVDQSKGEAGAQNATDRNYSMYAIDLHGLELEAGTVT